MFFEENPVRQSTTFKPEELHHFHSGADTKKEESTFEGIPDEFRDRAETRLKALGERSSRCVASRKDGAGAPSLPDSSNLPSLGNLFPSAFRESEELGWIPEGWEVTNFGKVALNIRDSVDPSSLDSDLPYVGLEHIGRKVMYLSDWGRAGDVDSNKSKFQKGDILFGKLRPYFHKVCIVNFSGVCSTDILVFRAQKDYWQGYVQYQLFEDKFVEYANARSTGTRMPRASWKDMVAYLIAKPTNEIANHFNKIIEGYKAKAVVNVDGGSQLADLRDTLLPKLISGEFDLDDYKGESTGSGRKNEKEFQKGID
jgi:hypothetical protein